jgi:hypothetical protein
LRSCGPFGHTGSCHGEPLPMLARVHPESMLIGFAQILMP